MAQLEEKKSERMTITAEKDGNTITAIFENDTCQCGHHVSMTNAGAMMTHLKSKTHDRKMNKKNKENNAPKVNRIQSMFNNIKSKQTNASNTNNLSKKSNISRNHNQNINNKSEDPIHTHK
eukprot:134216_1